MAKLRDNLEITELSRAHNPHLTITNLRSYDRKKKSDAIMSHDFTIVYIVYEYTCSKYSFMEVNAREFPCVVLTHISKEWKFTLYTVGNMHVCILQCVCVCVCVCVVRCSHSV